MTVKLPPTNLEKRKHRRIGRNGIGRKYRLGKMGTAGQPSCTRLLLPAQKVQS